MKLAIVVSTFPPYRGGMGNAAATQARLLATRGFDVTVFTPAYDAQVRETPAPYQVKRLRPLLSLGNGAWLPTLPRHLRGFDAVLVHYPFFGGVESLAVARRLPPLALYYHMDAIGRRLFRTTFITHRWAFLRPLLQRSQAVLVSTLEYARTSALSARLPSLVDRLSVIPFSVDTTLFSSTTSSGNHRDRLRIPADAPVALFVGSLDRAHYFKGIPVLLEAWQRLVNDLRAHLIIVGSGDMQEAYEDEARKRGIQSRVHFVGNVSDAQLPEYYAASNVVVLPSVDGSEAFGLVVLEAMASGRPVVASRLPGVSTVVREGETGYLVPPGQSSHLTDALQRVLTDRELQARMGTAAREIALREYSESVVGDQLAEVMRKLRTS